MTNKTTTLTEKLFGVKRLQGIQWLWPAYWIASIGAGTYFWFWVRPENERIREYNEWKEMEERKRRELRRRQ
jgi:hypothetical protein